MLDDSFHKLFPLAVQKREQISDTRSPSQARSFCLNSDITSCVGKTAQNLTTIAQDMLMFRMQGIAIIGTGAKLSDCLFRALRI